VFTVLLLLLLFVVTINLQTSRSLGYLNHLHDSTEASAAAAAAAPAVHAIRIGMPRRIGNRWNRENRRKTERRTLSYVRMIRHRGDAKKQHSSAVFYRIVLNNLIYRVRRIKKNNPLGKIYYLS